MIVSHFELVYKPQSPAGPADTVLQGYFLEITNLEAIQLEFALSFTTSPITDVNRSLFRNAAVFVDTPGIDNNIGVFSITGALASKSFGMNRRIVVPAHGTALLALLPSDPFPPALVPPSMANFECRGYATLTLPPFLFRAQAAAPVKVLLTAQNRTQYSDPATGVPKGQSQSSLPITTGKAENLIASGQPLFDFDDLVFDRDLMNKLPFIENLSPVQLMAALMAEAQAAGMDLREFNAALKTAGINLAVENRKPG